MLFNAAVAGPSWSIPLKPSELGSILTMLQQLRMMVADLDAKGQWLPGAGERPASRVKRESSHIEVKAGYAPTEPGFSVEFTFKSSRYMGGWALQGCGTFWVVLCGCATWSFNISRSCCPWPTQHYSIQH